MKTVVHILGILLWPTLLIAQEPAAVRKVVLPSLDSQVGARLLALDARLNPVHSTSLAISLTAQLAASGSPWTAFTPILVDERNNDVWEQLAEDYARLMLESGDALVTVQERAANGAAWTSTQVRLLCHQRLASLPRTSRELYRQTVNAEAKALLEQGRQKRSSVPLRRLVNDVFCSKYADQALDLLGDLAFERGDFVEAWHWWSLLAPRDDLAGDRLRIPDPQVDIPRVHAKQVLALIFQGRLDEAPAELDRFRRRHPNSQGDLAGERGSYHQILDKTLAALRRERIANNDEPWTTFGGDPSRNRSISIGMAWHLAEDGPAWRVKLPSLTPPGKSALPGRGTLTRGVAFHPIIVHDQVLIADHRSVVSYHLKTGKEAFRYDLKTAGLIDPGAGVERAVRSPHFTLSADHERAYVRLGGLKIGPRKEGGIEEISYLVCLDLTEPGRDKARELWHVKANEDDKAPACFEGSPLVHDGRVYVALTRIVDRHAVASICCYDMLGRLRWSREVCDATEFVEYGSGPRSRQHLLTLAGGLIVYANHAGAIVAVDAWTGQPTWAVRYPSQTRESAARDLIPCVYTDGRVYAAPADSNRLLCIDAVSGQVNWEAEGTDVMHLMGVSHDRVFVATQSGVQALSVSSGRPDWMQPSEGRLPSLGRGVMAGNLLYWPTQDPQLPYRVVSMRDGMPAIDPSAFASLPAGNWALGQGCLAIVGMGEMFLYLPARLAPSDLRPQVRIDRFFQEAHGRVVGFRGRGIE